MEGNTVKEKKTYSEIKAKGMDVHHNVPLNFNTKPDDAMSQPYSAEAESWFTKRFLKCE